MLSKKYYQIFAKLLGTSNNLQDFKNNLEKFLITDNERFDLTKFEKAVNHHDQ